MVRKKVTKKKGHPTDSESSEGYETGSDGDIYVKRKTSSKKGAIKRNVRGRGAGNPTGQGRGNPPSRARG